MKNGGVILIKNVTLLKESLIQLFAEFVVTNTVISD